jgi:aminomethyltransferase
MTAGPEMTTGNPIPSEAPLRRTPLHDAHVSLSARIVPFAGYAMPVQYPKGIIAEHNWTRAHAGLFDVSHMGQAALVGPDHETTSKSLEALVPGDIVGLKPGAIRYTMLTTDSGGIIDDLMVTRPILPEEDGRLYLVVNASRKEVDYAHIAARLPAGIRLEPEESRGLIALQGPQAAEVMERHAYEAVRLGFMRAAPAVVDGVDCRVSRSGYTGEDGFEISIPASRTEEIWHALLSEPEVEAIGLGARDTLRLEAGLCLYGHDIDETTSPVEAGLAWAIGRRRREEGGFPGAERILKELAEGAGARAGGGGGGRRGVGLKLDGRARAREGSEIVADGAPVGMVTSGGFGPTVGAPVAMCYVDTARSERGTPLDLMVRGRAQPATVTDLPFVPHRYRRGGE